MTTPTDEAVFVDEPSPLGTAGSDLLMDGDVSVASRFGELAAK